MLASRLIGALSSLLLLILLVGIPTSEAIKCPVGGYCEWTGNPINHTNIVLPNKECKDACFRFACNVEDKNMIGWGCEDDLRAVCPDFTDANITALKNGRFNGTNIFSLLTDTYYAFSCKEGNCINDLNTDEGLLDAMNNHKHVYIPPDFLLLPKLPGKNYHPCDYTGGKPAASTDNAAILHKVPMILGWIMAGWIAAQF